LDHYLIGHIINDSHDNTQGLINSKTSIEIGKNCVEYMMKTIKYRNCILIPTNDYGYVKTIKPIDKGKELLTSYGILYWRKNLTEVDMLKSIREYMSTLNHNQKIYVVKLTSDYNQLFL
jgi:hypothetical protein